MNNYKLIRQRTRIARAIKQIRVIKNKTQCTRDAIYSLKGIAKNYSKR